MEAPTPHGPRDDPSGPALEALLEPPSGAGAWPLVVVGAGAAGLLAATFAARGGVPTLVLETRPRPGAKIRVSGGGRCNLLPSAASGEDFHTEGSRNAMRKALSSWPLAEVRAFFEDELGIALKVEASGKVFPASDDPREVVARLLEAVAGAGARLAGGARVASLARDPQDPEGFLLELAGGPSLRARRPVRARRVVLATGGLSLPKTGSDGAGFAFARELGLELVATYPALVPLLAGEGARSEGEAWAALAGVSLPAELTVWRDGRRQASFEGDLLFTHRGFSGPVVLDASHQLTAPWGAGAGLTARWLAGAAPDWERLLGSAGRGAGARTVAGVLREHLPRRLATLLAARAGVPAARKLAQLERGERLRLITALSASPLPVAGDEGYRTAEVTGGGVPLGALVTRTLEARAVPGLHFAGEVVDVTGRIGGFNFLWAWVSGRLVGRAVAQRVGKNPS